MDSTTINFLAKNGLGFFLTSGPETDATKSEFALFKEVADFAAKQLFENKIRSGNVHDEANWSKIYKLACEMEDLVHDRLKEPEFKELDEGFKADGSALAWSFAIIYAALGQYNAIVERRKAYEKKNKDRAAPRREKSE